MTRLDGPGDDRSEGSGDDPHGIALEIADAVESLTNLWSVAAQQAALRMSVHQLRALLVLKTASELNLTSLAERLGIGLPTASRLCDRLEAAGMLERSLHPEKRREVRLGLTAQGHRVLDDVAARRAQALADVLRGMEPAERSALRRGMRAFLAARGGVPRSPDAR
ncbi:MarR family winged helix-turn-helix transcriptional regulator [Streptomyces sp. PDY-4]|uniref:MarR family winged helix-turn-helix transcriptional regulator n=1 Tax=Streptomyces TaxID=1883 RepID=UPI001151C851|nr:MULTISPECIES: MarR family transcriptional regulator [unclassified Streptomyces]QKW02413.1 MarR family transcriptional regulator [Streptomyces sp. NA02536]TQL20405.1 DNA-binding MarR family transcriptional regulator [Streptomyces sp. SLBN-134]